jgi:hypothetical protein
MFADVRIEAVQQTSGAGALEAFPANRMADIARYVLVRVSAS